MSRGLSAPDQALLGGTVLYPAKFVEFQFDSGTTRFWSGESAISADMGDGSQTWTGGGTLGSIEFSGETDDLSARQMTFRLNGVSTAYYDLVQSEEGGIRGRPVKVWQAYMDSTGASVLYKYLVEEGRIDVLTIQEQGETITLILTAESRLLDMFKPNRVFLSPNDHKKVYPDDEFYQYTATLPSVELPWGLANASSGSTGGDSGGGGGTQPIPD